MSIAINIGNSVEMLRQLKRTYVTVNFDRYLSKLLV